MSPPGTSDPHDSPEPPDPPDSIALPVPSAPADLEAVRRAIDATRDIVDRRIADGPFAPTWDSLDGYRTPEWLLDCKFGLYFHWGLYSVPAYRYEWYPKWMYAPDREGWGASVHDHHVETYGDPADYPYERFAESFRAERFDPDAWAELFAASGAGVAGPVAEHHDGWSNWPSAINPYNADAMGPERDLVGELEAAIRDRGLEFLTTFHHGRAARPGRARDGHDVYAGGYYGSVYERYPELVEGFPEQLLYRNVDDETRWGMWLGKLVEVCERYEPDLVFHDELHVPPEQLRREYLAYNLDRAAAQGRDVAITYKEVDFHDVTGPVETLTRDYENGVPDGIQDRPFLSNTSIADIGWAYSAGQGYRSVEYLLDMLIEIVAKGGVFLLDLTPRADGTFPDPVEQRLRAVGEWLDVHGEAIYATRPWRQWADEGAEATGAAGGLDVRYTRSKDGETLYAILVGAPGGRVRLPAVPRPGSASGASAALLGHGEVGYSVAGGDVVLDLPDGGGADEHASAVRLGGFIG